MDTEPLLRRCGLKISTLVFLNSLNKLFSKYNLCQYDNYVPDYESMGGPTAGFFVSMLVFLKSGRINTAKDKPIK